MRVITLVDFGPHSISSINSLKYELNLNNKNVLKFVILN